MPIVCSTYIKFVHKKEGENKYLKGDVSHITSILFVTGERKCMES